jgi:hypothetical protein
MLPCYHDGEYFEFRVISNAKPAAEKTFQRVIFRGNIQMLY